MFVTSCSLQGVTSNVGNSNEIPPEVYITLEGGSGKAHIDSPVKITQKDGKIYATLVWNSENYDYVKVDGIRYENENPGGMSTFTVPVNSFEEPLDIIGDTTAMSVPHEIEYRIIWNASEDGTQENSGKDDKGFGVRSGDDPPVLNGDAPDNKMELHYATGFDIYYYKDLKLIRIYGVGDHLIIPGDEAVPADIPDDVTIIRSPVTKTYLVSSSVMDILRCIDALDHIKLSALTAEDWYIDEAKARMKEGKIIYAGKYRAPDYELILSEGCDLAIENTMIYHDPGVKEKLEELGIPVMVETSSYEKDPRGRLEWIRLYGVLFDRQAEADEFFIQQEKLIGSAIPEEKTDKTVAVFYISATGTINVRIPGDYITKIIEMCKAEYVPASSDAKRSGMGTLNMQPEDFYAAAKDADILIYNGTIDKAISSVDDLTAKNAIFADFKAVKEGNVYCLSPELFQKTTEVAAFFEDMAAVVSGTDRQYRFLEKL